MQVVKEWFKDFNLWNLRDVLIASLSNKSILVYDSTSLKWENKRAEELTVLPWKIEADTEFIIPENKQMINYNGLEIRGQLTIRGILVLK